MKDLNKEIAKLINDDSPSFYFNQRTGILKIRTRDRNPFIFYSSLIRGSIYNISLYTIGSKGNVTHCFKSGWKNRRH